MQLKIESLQDAAKAGDIEAARKLLDGGADIDGKDKRGITPLGVAVGFNKISFVEMLLEKGVNVETCDPKGNTALHYAAGKLQTRTISIKHQNLCVQWPRSVAHTISDPLLLLDHIRFQCNTQFGRLISWPQ